MNRNDEIMDNMEQRLDAYYGATRVDGNKARAWIDKGIMKAKHRHTIGYTMGISLVGLCFVFMVCINVFPGFYHVMANVPIIGTFADVIVVNDIQQSTGVTTFSVEQPLINESAPVPANQDIDTYVKALIDQYHLDTNGNSGHYELLSHYSVVCDNNQYLSIRFDTSIVMAGATQTVRTFTIDKATGEVVSLFHVLNHDQTRLDLISDNIKTQMKTRMENDPNQQYWLDSEVEAWNFDGLDGDESFYFNEDDQLVIEFNELDVAPGYMGVVSFTIPLEVTGQLIHG